MFHVISFLKVGFNMNPTCSQPFIELSFALVNLSQHLIVWCHFRRHYKFLQKVIFVAALFCNLHGSQLPWLGTHFNGQHATKVVCHSFLFPFRGVGPLLFAIAMDRHSFWGTLSWSDLKSSKWNSNHFIHINSTPCSLLTEHVVLRWTSRGKGPSSKH